MFYCRFVLAASLVAFCGSQASAQCATGCADSCNQTCVQCPSCQAHCVFEANVVDVDKKCFEVECEPICIPKVRFPWQTPCEPMCAEVRWVKVLKKSSYTCTECEYSWHAEVTGCGSGCGGGCAGGCEVAAPSAPVPTPAVPEAATTSFRLFDSGIFAPRTEPLPVIQVGNQVPVQQVPVHIDAASGKPISSRRIR